MMAYDFGESDAVQILLDCELGCPLPAQRNIASGHGVPAGIVGGEKSRAIVTEVCRTYGFIDAQNLAAVHFAIDSSAGRTQTGHGHESDCNDNSAVEHASPPISRSLGPEKAQALSTYRGRTIIGCSLSST